MSPWVTFIINHIPNMRGSAECFISVALDNYIAGFIYDYKSVEEKVGI